MGAYFCQCKGLKVKMEAEIQRMNVHVLKDSMIITMNFRKTFNMD